MKRTLDEQATVLMRVKWISSKAEGIPLSTIIRPDGAQPPLAELAQAQAAHQAQIVAQMQQQVHTAWASIKWLGLGSKMCWLIVKYWEVGQVLGDWVPALEKTLVHRAIWV